MTEPAKQAEFDELPSLYKLVLSCIPYGKVNAIPAKKLAKACGTSKRRVTAIVSELRLLGYLIGSSKGMNSGYFREISMTESMQVQRMLDHGRDFSIKIANAHRRAMVANRGRFTEHPTLDNNHAEQLNLDV
ncbi:MAG: hypothetical protein NC090_06795 [Anaeroplasma bactoclasticum]|nr:hypothetical protein [Anaeroplasma bactoclasticum]